MSPLSCARVHAHIGRETSHGHQDVRAHTRKLGVHINIPSRNVFTPISYMSFQIQISSGKMLHKRNFMCTQTLKT